MDFFDNLQNNQAQLNSQGNGDLVLRADTRGDI